MQSRTFNITPCMLPLEVLPYSITQHGSTSQVVCWGILPEDLGGGQALTTLCRSDTEAYKAKARQESAVYCTQIACRDCFKGCKQGTERQSETSLLLCVEWLKRLTFYYSNLCWTPEIVPLCTFKSSSWTAPHPACTKIQWEAHLRSSQTGHPQHRQD